MITNNFMRYFCTRVKKNTKETFFTEQLLSWNASENNRQMPWKGEKDPYKIWLSEIILQQTRVEQGLEYYKRFIKNYPTVIDLAAAKDTDVFKLWEGLGYYSRCRNLLASARVIADELGGKFPDTYDDILKLKGVGAYTAAAVASFAYNHAHAVVDGNVTRVLSRYFAIDTPIDTTEGKKQYAELAQSLLDKPFAGIYNQAIMDFGATICKPQVPLCHECVLQKKCGAFALGIVNELPIKEKKLIKKHRWFYYIIAEHKEKIYVRIRTEKDIWQNLHDFILIEKSDGILPEKIIETEEFQSVFGRDFSLFQTSGMYKQLLTHQVIKGAFIYLKIKRPLRLKGYELLDKDQISKLAFPRFINDYLQRSGILKNA